MECSRFALEKVGQSESPEFLRHLATCSGCQRDVEEMDEIRALYRASSTERYQGGVPRHRRLGWGAWISSVTGAAVMMAALVFLMLPRVKPEVGALSSSSEAFFHVSLEPWRVDLPLDRDFASCWDELDRLERSR